VATKKGAVEVMELSASHWAGKRVFVTGHTGFKGGWALLMLKQLGAQVYGFSLPPNSKPNLFTEARIADLTTGSSFEDLRNKEAVQTALHKADPDVVLHMGAQALVSEGYADPAGTFATNVMGCVHLFEAVRSLGKPVVTVNVTSDKCYENREWLWPYRENDPMGGHDPYSSSKGCAEIVTAAYRSSFFSKNQVRLASARAGNVIGGGDWSETRLIPDALRAFDADTDLVLRSPNSIRPWQHVLEPICGYLLLAQQMMTSDAFNEAWNFGPNEDDVQTVERVVDRLNSFLGAQTTSRTVKQTYHEASLLTLDSSKARSRLAWRRRWSLDDALKMTAEWHLAYRSGKDIRELCDMQIGTYLGHVK
jgi:CDP-glucose 4,6-dehydratase